METTIDNAYILAFLNEQRLAILSTVNERGTPDAAPIYFTVHDDFTTLFLTSDATHKRTNMQLHREVVLTVTHEEHQETVQIRGRAEERPEALVEVVNELSKKLNSGSRFTTVLPALKHTGKEEVVIAIIPIEVRLRRYTEHGVEERIADLNV